jgi:hypothetical protein
MPKISVTMAVRNAERYLAEAIESVLGQTFTDFEFIIVDFGSADKSKSIVSAYVRADSRIKYFEIPDTSLTAARNEACARAAGQYVAVMDADDICLPGRLQSEIAFMDKRPDVGLVGGTAEWINGVGQTIGIYPNAVEDDQIRLALLVKCPFWHPTVLVRREALARIGGYRDAFVLAHDYDMELRVAEHYRVANLADVVLKYRIHANQVSLKRQREQSLCKLAAQAAASRRKLGQPDPFSAGVKITPAALLSLGISEDTQGRHFFGDFHAWIMHMCLAGEFDVAISAVDEILQTTEVRYSYRWQRADLWLISARSRWGRGEYFKSLAAVLHSVTLSPSVLGRPLKHMLRWARKRGKF